MQEVIYWLKRIFEALAVDRKFKAEDVSVHSVSGELIHSNCAAIEFYVQTGSTTPAFINGREIAVGAAWSPPTEKNEMDCSKYKYTFDITLAFTLIVTKKNYL